MKSVNLYRELPPLLLVLLWIVVWERGWSWLHIISKPTPVYYGYIGIALVGTTALGQLRRWYVKR